MKVSPINLTVPIWNVRKDIIAQNKGKAIELGHYLNAQEALSFAEDDKEFPVIGFRMRWMYGMTLSSGEKFLEYEVVDEMFLDITDNSYSTLEIEKAIRDSFSRAALKFDDLKAEVHFRNGLPFLDQEFLQIMTQKILDRIQNKY